jgi:hypothetical protein
LLRVCLIFYFGLVIFFENIITPSPDEPVLSVLPKLGPFNVGEEPRLFFEDFFQLICSVLQGDSPFTFEWLFQNRSISNNRDTSIESTKRSSTLNIESVTAKHTGSYTCKVHNHAGHASITTALIVRGWFAT